MGLKIYFVNILFVCFLVVACKPTSKHVTKSPRQLSNDTNDKMEAPGPLSNNANDAELREQFSNILAKYKSLPTKEFGLTASKSGLNRDRRPKTLNVKMRAPTAMIAKTSGRQGGGDQGAPLRAAGGKIRKELPSAKVVSVNFPDAHDDRYMAAVVEFLTKDHRIEKVEPDYSVRAVAVPNDPSFPELWGLKNTVTQFDINVLSAWDLTKGSRSVVVGVIDTGIDCQHPDLAENCWVNPGEDGLDGNGRPKRSNSLDDDGNGYIDDWQGWNFIDENNNAMDDNQHGTHVAGTIGALGNNRLGIVGVNWQVSFLPLKFLSASGWGYTSDAIEAIDYATKMNLVATNNSWAGGEFSDLMVQAIERANSAGSLFIAAAGNTGQDNDLTPTYPASYESANIISVGALDVRGRLARFSCYGKTSVDIAAPGDLILSTLPGGRYGELSGTSMAAPHVTGAVALLKAKHPDETAAEIKARVLKHVTPLPQAGESSLLTSGGMLNVTSAMEGPPDIEPPSAPTRLRVTESDLVKTDARKDNFLATMNASISFSGSTDNSKTGRASRYEIRISDSHIIDESAWERATITTPESLEINSTNNSIKAVLKGLPLSYSGYLAARAYDEANNVSPLSESVQLKTLNFKSLLTFDGSNPVDSGSAWVVEEDPKRGKVYSDGLGEYPANSSRKMTLREFKIPNGFSRLALRYWTRFEIGVFSSTPKQQGDFGRVYIKDDPGANIKIDELTGYSEWTPRTIDLTEIAWGQKSVGRESLSVFFELTSDGSDQDSGWLVDDIEFLVDDQIISAHGLPEDLSADTKLLVQFAAMPGTLYSAKYIPGGNANCMGLTYATEEPSSPLSETFEINQLASTYGRQGLCVKAKVPGVANLIFANYQWTYESSASLVDASGYPGGTSNARTFNLKVQPAIGSSATQFMYALTSDFDSVEKLGDCPKSENRLRWSDWIPISSRPTVQIPNDIDGNNVVVTLCVKGKSADGLIQNTPRKYTWTGDFIGPDVQIEDAPRNVNNLNVFTVNLKSNEGLTSCKVRILAGSGLSCPGAFESFTDCSVQPKEHVIRVPTDGTYLLCMYGYDKAGNASKTPAQFIWTRDTTPPIAQLTGVPPTSSKNQTAVLSVTGTDVSYYRFATASTEDRCTEWSNKTPVEKAINIRIVNGKDGPRVLCVKGSDDVGNEQLQPTVMRWTQDTVALPVNFSGLPGKFSNNKSLDVKVTSIEPGTYQYAVVSGPKCLNNPSLWSNPLPTNKAITTALPEPDGVYTICAIFTDLAGNVQPEPSSYTWTKQTLAPTAMIVGDFSLAPNSATTLNLRVGDANVAFYQYALVKSWNTTCTAGVNYGPWTDISSILSAVISNPGDNYMTLCLRGRDLAGNIQLNPSSYRWVRFSQAPEKPASMIFAAIATKVRKSGALVIDFTRLSNVSTKESATSMMCALEPSTGAITKCMKRVVNFSRGAATASVIYGKISKGIWVNILLPAQSDRGWVQPVIVHY